MQTNIRIHLTDDDPDDRLLIREAMLDADIESPRDYTVDGQDLMDYLHRQGAYAAAPALPMPDLLLLDLNTPKKIVVNAFKKFTRRPT